MPCPFSDPQYKKVIDKLVQVQWRATTIGQWLEHLYCRESLRTWRRDGFKVQTKACSTQESRGKFFTVVWVRETTGLSWNKREPNWPWGKSSSPWGSQAVEQPVQGGCALPILGIFKVQLDSKVQLWAAWSDPKADLALRKRLETWPSAVPSNINYLLIFCLMHLPFG